MSDVSPIHTQIAKAPQGAGAANVSAKSANPLFARIDGQSFFDLIQGNNNVDLGTAITADGSGLAFNLAGQGTTTTLDAAGLKTLKSALDSLLQGMPADQKPIAITLTGTQLKAIAQQNLNTSPGDISSGQKALIATGLTPEQLTRLAALIAQQNSGQSGGQNAAAATLANPVMNTTAAPATNSNPVADTAPTDTAGTDVAAQTADSGLQALLVGILKITGSGNSAQAIFVPKGVIVTPESSLSGSKDASRDQNTDTLLGAVNALFIVPQQQDSAPKMQAAGGITGNGSVAPGAGSAGGINNNFMGLLGKIQGALEGLAQNTQNAGPQNAAGTAQPGPLNSTVPAGANSENFSSLFGMSADSGSLGALAADGSDPNKSSLMTFGMPQASAANHVTSLVTQAASAAQAHPATQVVVATLTRAAGDGQTKSMTLDLDPPELGRIEIQMQFTKDKSVKAHMIFEKPETMLMMQRDSSTLQQALQNSGLSADSGGLSFELAGQDSFSQNGNNGGNGNGGNTGNGPSADQQIIETTLSWSVDPETGLHHYNAIV